MREQKLDLKGHLDIFVSDNEDDVEGQTEKWQNVLIHGDPEGLRYFAQLLNELADLNQDDLKNLPSGA